MSCDNQDPLSHWVMGGAWFMNHDPASTIGSLQTAIRLNPSLSGAYLSLGQLQAFTGNPKEALRSLDTAMRLSPSDPATWAMMIVKAVAFGIMGEFEEAERWARRSIRQPNAGPHPSVTHLAMLGHLSRSEEAELIK